MQTSEQLASARMGAELSLRPTLRFPLTSSHMNEMEITEMIKPGMVVSGLWAVKRL